MKNSLLLDEKYVHKPCILIELNSSYYNIV